MFCADIGNYSALTAIKGQSPRMMRSVFYDATVTSARDSEQDDSPTVLVDGKVLILGSRAVRHASGQSTVEKGKHKPEVVKPFVLGALREDYQGVIRFLVPERERWAEDAIRDSLVATHEVEVNSKKYQHFINGVEFYLETDIAVSHAYRRGNLDPMGDTLAIDIGGGTTNYLVMTPSHDVLIRRSMPNVGGVTLANAIIDTDLMQQFAKRENTSFKVSKVMDAIADGSLTYGRRYDFSPVFPTVLGNWFDRLMDSIQTAASDYISDVTNIMIIGGNANLVREQLGSQPGFYIPAAPELANIAALAAL